MIFDFSSLKRHTSGKFFPEIDGIRFIAVSMVVLHHIIGYTAVKLPNIYNGNIIKQKLESFFAIGYTGVELFFAVSGFILAYPFALHYINSEKKPDLKAYFIRRLTRLEPPYIIALVLFLTIKLIHAKVDSLYLIKSFFASLFYVHEFVFNSPSEINGVLWSLEIEVQFYLLAPFLASIFMLRKGIRRIILIFVIIIAVFIPNFLPSNHVSIYGNLQYFLIGFLLCDFKINGLKLDLNKYLVLGITSLLIYLLFKHNIRFYYDQPLIKSMYQLSLCFVIFSLCSLILFNESVKKVFSLNFLTIIGGMCYTIYLLHFNLISLFGYFALSTFPLTKIYVVDVSLFGIYFLLIIGIFSLLFFKLIEQPCMKKDWYKKYIKS